MTNRLAGSLKDVDRMGDMLKKGEPPSSRKAYSDRTAWLMACLSELAYVKFNPLLKGNHSITRIAGLIDEGKLKSLQELAIRFGYDHDEEKKELEQTLAFMDFTLGKTFDRHGTQAFIVSNSSSAVLAFRGTEADSIKDIKADAKAVLVDCESGGKVHQGFDDAFKAVAQDIQNELDNEKYATLPLYITGHSLGGALATIAAKKLSHNSGLAACYTFGAPRVGDEEWISQIKTPLYRIVNAADCVTMLPPGDEFITAASWGLKIVPYVGEKLSSWLTAKVGGYLHCGNMRYLTNCQKGAYADVRLLYSVSLWYRIKGWFIKKLPWKKFLSDHSIAVYRKKLFVIAETRNQYA